MTSSEETIRSVLTRTVPLPPDSGRNWDDVVARSAATARIVRARRLVYAVVLAATVATVIAITPLGAVIARGFGDFSGWLSGQAGHPASTREQQTFAQESRHSWVQFPKTPALRSLITASRDGVRYELFGYRTGGSYCLRLVASGAARSRYTSCALRSDLTARSAPVLPVLVDAPINGKIAGRISERASVSFGITSDGVAGVRARTKSRGLKGIVAGDSFLIVYVLPRVGERTRSISASDPNGDVAAIPFAQAPFENDLGPGTARRPLGPWKLERFVKGAKISWLEKREPRGRAVPERLLRATRVLPLSAPTFERLLAPDPNGTKRLIVSLRKNGYVCLDEVSAGSIGGSCGPLKQLFSDNWIGAFGAGSMGGGLGGSQYMTNVGLVSDDVVRMTLFLATGERIAVPVKDNAFGVDVARTAYPIRLVAYDRDGLVIGINTIPDLAGGSAGKPAKDAAWKPAFHVRSPGGETRTLSLVRSTTGGLCWKATPFVIGRGSGTPPLCPDEYSWEYRPPVSLPSEVTGKSMFFYGRVAPFVVRVAFHLVNGEIVSVIPRHGYVLMAVGGPTKAQPRPVRMIVGFDKNGKEVGREDLREWVSLDVLARKYHLSPVPKGQASK